MHVFKKTKKKKKNFSYLAWGGRWAADAYIPAYFFDNFMNIVSRRKATYVRN